MPDPRQGHNVSQSEFEFYVNAADVDSDSHETADARREQIAYFTINVPGQYTFRFTGKGFKISDLQLSFDFARPPQQIDPLASHVSQLPPEPEQDLRSPERRIYEFEREQYRVTPYAPKYGFDSYPARKAVR